MNGFVKHTSECTVTTDATKKDNAPKEGKEKFVVFMCMKNSEQ